MRVLVAPQSRHRQGTTTARSGIPKVRAHRPGSYGGRGRDGPRLTARATSPSQGPRSVSWYLPAHGPQDLRPTMGGRSRLTATTKDEPRSCVQARRNDQGDCSGHALLVVPVEAARSATSETSPRSGACTGRGSGQPISSDRDSASNGSARGGRRASSASAARRGRAHRRDRGAGAAVPPPTETSRRGAVRSDVPSGAPRGDRLICGANGRIGALFGLLALAHEHRPSAVRCQKNEEQLLRPYGQEPRRQGRRQ